jgi:hypothetical protein
LRETALRAQQAGLADVSGVAVLKRLRNAGEWWRRLCGALLQESGFALRTEMRGWNVRAIDGSLIQEPGAGGTRWRVHYSLRLPELECDHLEFGDGARCRRLIDDGLFGFLDLCVGSVVEIVDVFIGETGQSLEVTVLERRFELVVRQDFEG